MKESEHQQEDSIFQQIKTTNHLLLHFVLSPLQLSQRSPLFLGIIGSAVSVAITFVPLLASALIELPSLVVNYKQVTLPFLLDGNVLFMFLASLPLLVAFTVTDEETLRRAVITIEQEGILSTSKDDAKNIINSSVQWFSKINVLAQFIGVIVGSLIATCNYIVYSNPRIGYWAVNGGTFTITGWLYLYCVFVFYCTVCITLFRAFSMYLFLKKLVKKSKISLVPFHPDRCGGLRPVGRLALRTQYVLSALGVNLVILSVIYPAHLAFADMTGLKILLATAATAYIILTPIYFVLPLLPFRNAMQQEKLNRLHEVSRRLTLELENVRQKIHDGTITKEDEDVLDRLRKVISILNDFPVWPFDASTLKKFFTAYFAPVATSVVIKYVPNLVSTVFR